MNEKKIFISNTKNVFALNYFNLLKTSSWIEMQIKEALKPYDLTHSQLNVLSVLVKSHPDPLDAKTIKESIIVASPDVTRLIDRLVIKGFVDRKTCPANRRKIDISVTENGMDFFFKVHRVAREALNNYFKDQLTEEEARMMYKLLGKMRTKN
ncbi:MAG: DNA-binding MarR family transcriptional regulator [Flavobacteriaceae bacterium]|jgi:DNA-binding MarR family transcriptional regulator